MNGLKWSLPSLELDLEFPSLFQKRLPTVLGWNQFACLQRIQADNNKCPKISKTKLEDQ